MSEPADEMTAALQASAARALGGSPRIADLGRLSGGASQESWRFELVLDGAREPLVLRRMPSGRGSRGFSTVDLATEARLIALAGAAGVPVPGIRWELAEADGLGSGYVMTAVEGEALPRRILRDAAFDGVRERLARQCGEILARLHALPAARLPALPELDAARQIDQLRSLYDGFGERRPVLEWAFRWLADNAPAAGGNALVHGDFRNGNLMVHPDDGIRGVLDWELAHLGDPMEDLGWLCVNSWRFGAIDKPVGGFGERADLFAGYEAVAGAAVDAERVRYWQIFGTLKWGVICLVQVFTHLSGQQRSLELAAIGRRVSEAELDLLRLLAAEAAPARAQLPPAAGEDFLRPTARELLEAAEEYLGGAPMQQDDGHARFQARVAYNVLGLIKRELALGPAMRERETRRLRNLLGRQETPDELNTRLCDSIRAGGIDPKDAGLLAHLWASTLDRIAIDQPDYAAYRQLFTPQPARESKH